MTELPSGTPSGAGLCQRFCFDRVDGGREDSIEHAGLLVVQAVGRVEGKVGDVSRHIGALAPRTMVQDCAWIVK
jgi:hypothetical protein